MIVIAVPPADIPAIWPQVRAGAAKMCRAALGLYTADDILNRLIGGQWILLQVHDGGQVIASIVAQVSQGSRKVFEIGFCWGTRMAEWSDDVYRALETIARELKCDTIALNGRPGWRNEARSRGFKVKSVTYAKEL
jgi:hypothetical protein